MADGSVSPDRRGCTVFHLTVIVLMPLAQSVFGCLTDPAFGRTPARNSCASSASGLESHQDPDAGLENIQGLPLDAAYGVQADIEAKPDGFD